MRDFGGEVMGAEYYGYCKQCKHVIELGKVRSIYDSTGLKPVMLDDAVAAFKRKNPTWTQGISMVTAFTSEHRKHDAGLWDDFSDKVPPFYFKIGEFGLYPKRTWRFTAMFHRSADDWKMQLREGRKAVLKARKTLQLRRATLAAKGKK